LRRARSVSLARRGRLTIEDQRGISSIVGLALITGLVLTVGLSTYIRDWVPWEQRDKEYNVMHEVQQSFRDMKETISSLAPGQGATMSIKMGAESASAYKYTTTGATLMVSPARDVGWISPTVDTHVREGNSNPNSDNENISVSPTKGQRAWSFLKFDLSDTDRRDDRNILLTDDGVYDNVTIVQAKLWLYIRSLDLGEGEFLNRMEAEVPVVVGVYPAVNDNAVNDNLRWSARNSTQPDFNRELSTSSLMYHDEWISFDVTSLVKGEYLTLLNNQLGNQQLTDNCVSFCVRGVVDTENLDNGLRRRANFVSENTIMYPWNQYKPYLEIVYSRESGGPAYARPGVVDSGYIEYQSKNAEFPDQYFIYEGGALILQQYGWYDVMLPGGQPEDLIQVSLAEGNNIRVTVTRYRIVSTGAEWMSGGGWAGLSFSIANEENLVQAGATPNVAKVDVAIVSDNPREWRPYLQRLAARLNYMMGSGYWSSFGDYVKYDYSRVSLTIYGKNLDPSVPDIYYTEKVVDIEVALR